MTRRTARETIVLARGFVQAIEGGRFRAAGSVTVITGNPTIIVDTGGPDQQQEILDNFALHRVDPAAVEFVINTHGHLDHVGNNNLFPRATFVLDGDIARDAEYWTHDFRVTPMVIESNGLSSPVTVMATPGHTDHDVSVLVETDAGVVAIVGDLFEYEHDALDNAWRRWSRDVVRQLESRERILALADFIVPGHGDIFSVGRRQ